MSQSKFIALVSQLTPNELTSLRKQVMAKTSKESDIFNLYEYLHRNSTKLAELIDTRSLQKKIFPKSSTKTIANYMSTLYLWAKEWMVMQQLENEPYSADVLAAKWLNNKGLFHLSNMATDDLERQIEKSNSVSLEKLKAKHEFYHNEHYSNNPKKYDLGFYSIDNIVSTYLQTIHTQLLIYNIEVINWGKINKQDTTKLESQVSEIVVHLPKSKLTDILLDLKSLIAQPKIDLFDNLYTKLLSGIFDQNSSLNKLVFLYLITCHLKLNSIGKKIDLQKIMNLYEFGFSSGAILENGTVSQITFFNTVSIISNANDYLRTKEFIKDHIHFVVSNNKEAYFSLINGLNAFYHHHYNEAMKLTWRSDFESITLKIDANFVHLLSAYTLRDQDPLQFKNELQNTKTFLKRHKKNLSERKYEGLTNLLHFIDQRLFNKQKDLETYHQLQYRSWCEYVLNHNL